MQAGHRKEIKIMKRYGQVIKVKPEFLARYKELHANPWPEIDKVKDWMISAETAQFMKMGGLGMIASELPEAYNRMYAGEGDDIKVVTPLYLGNTGKKKASFEDGVYYGAEGKSAKLDKVTTIEGGYLDIGLIDTMKDLMVNFIGAVVFSILGFLYIKDRDEYKFIERFIPSFKKFQEE